jgi:hypothetical protein
MKHIKEFSEFINERLSMEAVYIHQITSCGQDSAQNFIDDNNIDGKKLADYVKQHKDSKEKYDVRDMIKDPSSNKKLLKKFVNEGSQVNEASLVDYSKSRNKILVGLKTNLLRNMKDRYESKEDGENLHFFDKGKHIGTLFDLGSRFQELRHDGSLDDKGYRLNEDLDSTVSDPEIEEAWEAVYGHPLKHDHPSIFKILKQRPPIDSRELDRIWSETFEKTFKEQHPRVWDILFSDK